MAVGATARVVLPLVFGDDFEDSTTALLLLLPGRIVADQVTVVSNYLFGIGRPGNASAASVLAAVVTAAGLPLAVGRWDIEGAAAVTSISYVVQLAYLEVQRRRIGSSWIADRIDHADHADLADADAAAPAASGPATDGLPGDPV